MRVAVLCLCLCPGLAFAQSLHTETAGTSLAIDGPCAAQVTVTPDAGLSGRVVLDATAEHEEELAQLVLRPRGAGAELRRRGESCWPGAFRTVPSTLHIALRVPERFPMDVEEGGHAFYRIGDTHAPIEVDVSGDAHMEIGAVGSAKLEQSGSGTIALARLEGPAHVDMSGSGEIAIAEGAIPSLELALSGDGQFHFEHGRIGTLAVESSGSGRVAIGASVGSANLELSGSGGVRLHEVTGPLAREVSGSGSVVVENRR